MGSIPRTETLATHRKTITSRNRQALRDAIAKYAESGRLLTYTDPEPDPDEIGRYRAHLVLIDPDVAPVTVRIIPGELVPVRAVTVQPDTRRGRRTRTAYRRVRAVKRSTVVTTFTVAGYTAAAAVAAGLIYEMIRALIIAAQWVIAHAAEIGGGALVLLVIVALAAYARCETCGR